MILKLVCAVFSSSCHLQRSMTVYRLKSTIDIKEVYTAIDLLIKYSWWYNSSFLRKVQASFQYKKRYIGCFKRSQSYDNGKMVYTSNVSEHVFIHFANRIKYLYYKLMRKLIILKFKDSSKSSILIWLDLFCKNGLSLWDISDVSWSRIFWFNIHFLESLHKKFSSSI